MGSVIKKFVKKIKAVPVGARSAVVYTAATVFSRGLAIITVPIFTRIMPTDQIGIVNIYNSWYSLISVVATLSLTSGGFAVAMKEYAGKRNEYVSSILSLTSFIAICIGIVYAIAPSFWNNLLGLPTSLMCLMLVGFVVAPARDFWMARQRYEYKYKLPGAVSILSAIVASVLSIIIVLRMRSSGYESLGEYRLFANYLIIYGVATVIWLSIIVKGKTFINKEFWKFSLKLSIPLIGYQVAAQILNVSDRMMIDKMVGKSAVGIYGTLYTVSSISLLVWNAVNTSFVPYLFQNIDKKENKVKEISFGMLGAYAVIAVLLTFFAPEIVRILATEEYYKAIYIMPPISAGVFFISVAHMYSNILVYYKKTKYVMYGAAVAAVLNVALNATFIPIYGYMAAAYTTLFSYIIMAAMEAMWAIRLHKKQCGSESSVYGDKKNLVLSIITVALSLSGLIWYQYNVLRYIVIAITSVVAVYLLRIALNGKKNR